jgi:hypothetical protein
MAQGFTPEITRNFSSKSELTPLLTTTKEIGMKKIMLALAFLTVLGQSGCAFLGGAALGALGTSAGYEVNAKSKMDQLEADYKAERISRGEYEDRKSQLEKGSIIY